MVWKVLTKNNGIIFDNLNTIKIPRIMKNSYFFIALFVLFSVTLNAQVGQKTAPKKPTSIYTFSNIIKNKNSISGINKKLNLHNFDFLIVDPLDIDSNRFSINMKDICRTPSIYIYDDYIKYRDENLLKGFLMKNDPTQWNLQCPQPNLHP